jgi:hypothetical protein
MCDRVNILHRSSKDTTREIKLLIVVDCTLLGCLRGYGLNCCLGYAEGIDVDE